MITVTVTTTTTEAELAELSVLAGESLRDFDAGKLSEELERESRRYSGALAEEEEARLR